MWQPEYIRRVGDTNDKFTNNKVYLMKGPYILNDKGKNSKPWIDKIRGGRNTCWALATEKEFDQYTEEARREEDEKAYGLVKAQIEPELPSMRKLQPHEIENAIASPSPEDKVLYGQAIDKSSTSYRVRIRDNGQIVNLAPSNPNNFGENKMLKIESGITLINGNRSDKMTTETFLDFIKEEKSIIGNLSLLSSRCLTHLKLKREAKARIKQLEALMDANLPKEEK